MSSSNSTKLKVPKIRFKGFDKEWVEKQVIAPLQRGFDLPKNQLSIGPYPVGYSNGISAYHDSFKAVGPGVFTGRSGTIGKVHYVESDYWPHNTTLWVTDFKGNHEKFIYYFYTNLKLDRFDAGTGVPTLNRNDVHIFKTRIPSFAEQKKIASFLSLLDNKIEKQQEKVKQLEQYKRGMVQKIFLREVKFKDIYGKEFPNWIEVSLNQICTIEKGKQLNRAVLGQTMINNTFSVYNGGINPSGYHTAYNREPDTIIVSEGGNSCGYVNYIKEYFWSGGHCYTITPKMDVVDKKYLYQVLKANETKIMSLRVGSGLPNIQKSELQNYNVMISIDPSEQKKIGDFLSILDTKIEKEILKLVALNGQKEGFMQQMFI